MPSLRKLVLSLALAALGAGAGVLEEGWENPPAAARPQVWWHWMNGNVTREGITADLESMAESGIGGAHIFDIDYGIPKGPVAFNSEAWFEHVEWAAKEARRLGLELTVCTGSGWCSGGGPWDRIEDGMKYTCWSETRVAGPKAGPIPLPPGSGRCYHDIAVLAYPTPKPGSAPKIEEFPVKTFRFAFDNGYGGYNRNKDKYPASKGGLVRAEEVVDLGGRLDADGALDWNVPEGDWTILRLGYRSSGGTGYPQTDSGRGIEYDKLSRRAYDLHFDGYLGKLVARLGPLAGAHESGLTGVLLDSYEPGSQNWTEGLPAVFERTTGYPIAKYYPVLGGRVVGSLEESERFLRDYRRVIADMFAHNFADRQVERCHELGLKVYHEPYGECAPADFLQFGQKADIPMTEFWAGDPEKKQAWGGSFVAANIAHFWGQRIVAAEAFTTRPQDAAWRQDPFAIKAWNDMGWRSGVNRIVYHSWVMQPWTDEHMYPGMTQGRFGVHTGRTVTWWPMAKDWIKYQQRGQFLLQEGAFAPDVAVFIGDDAPLNVISSHERMKGSPSVQFDSINRDGLRALEFRNGRFYAPSGISYALLFINPAIEAIEPESLEAIGKLVQAGGRVAGRRPRKACGLRGWPAADAAVAKRAEEIWAAGVIDTDSFDEAVKRAGIRPDFLRDGNPNPRWFHRRYADGTEGYFVFSEFHRQARTFRCQFRVHDLVPEFWDPETGKRTLVEEYECDGTFTKLAVPLNEQGSVFVMFRPRARVTAKPAAEYRQVSAQTVEGPWKVAFPAGWDAPAEATFDRLVSWDTRDEEGIRYFSGIATYRRTVKLADVPAKGARRHYTLDLGDVKNLARVRVNGKEFPVLWKPPFRVDITEAVEGGELELEIEVANLWCNRLIGDELKREDTEWETKKPRWGGPGEHLVKWPDWYPDPSKRTSGRLTFSTWRHWHKGDQTLPSGLLGPVKVIGSLSSEDLPLPLRGGRARGAREEDDGSEAGLLARRGGRGTPCRAVPEAVRCLR